MLTFKAFKGINNVVPEHRLGAGDLLSATDVDIGLTGEISRRGGYRKVSGACHRDLWQAHGYLLAVVDSQLTAIHPDGARHIVYPSLGPERVWYCNLPDGRTAWANGLQHGVTDGATNQDRCVPAPSSIGAHDAHFGQLHPGTYRYHLTYVRLSDRLEGPAVSSAPVLLMDGGLRLDGLPMIEGHAINVYLSGQDGEGAYLAGTATARSYQFDGSNASLVLPCRTFGAQAFPVGTITAEWRGRVLVAQGAVLWAGRPMAPHLADWRDFRTMPAPITGIVPVDDGIYVGTAEDLVFLSGTTFDQLVYMARKTGPVVLGSAVPAPGRYLRLGDGAGAGPAMVCIAAGQVVAGFSGGQTASLTAGRYKTSVSEVAATFRVLGEVPQYMAVPR